VVDIAYKERKIAILLECQVKFLFLSKKSHMFTKAICKNYAISAFPGYPGIADLKYDVGRMSVDLVFDFPTKNDSRLPELKRIHAHVNA